MCAAAVLEELSRIDHGGRLEVLQRILGHNNINMTMRYGRVSQQRVIENYISAMSQEGSDEQKPAGRSRSILDLLGGGA